MAEKFKCELQRSDVQQQSEERTEITKNPESRERCDTEKKQSKDKDREEKKRVYNGIATCVGPPQCIDHQE